MVAHAAVAKAAPDGYTLLFSDIVAGYAVNPVLFPKTIQYNARTDFTPIAPRRQGPSSFLQARPFPRVMFRN